MLQCNKDHLPSLKVIYDIGNHRQEILLVCIGCAELDCFKKFIIKKEKI